MLCCTVSEGTYTVGHVLEQRLETREGELEFRIRRNGEAHEEDSSNSCANSHRSLPSNVLHIYCVVSDDGSWHANDRGDRIVAVCGTGRFDLPASSVAEVLRQKCIEQRVAHADSGPDKPDERGGNRLLPGVEQWPYALRGEF